MCSSKPRIIPWLISQIGSPMYPGLEWENSERTQFRVPWKHGRRQNQSGEEIKIFEAWAIASGCFNPLNDKPDPSRWKRNFRSALIGKDGIHMICNNSLDSNNPHKVYEITRGASAAAAGNDEQYASSNGSSTLQQSNSCSQQVGSAMHSNLSEDLQLTEFCADEEDLYLSLGELQSTMEDMNTNAILFAEQNATTSQQEYFDGATAAPAPVYYDGAYSACHDVPPYTASGVHVAEQVQSQPVQEDETFRQKVLKHFTNNLFATDFDVNIYYRGKLVKSTLVENLHGFYISSMEQTIPGSCLDHVSLPQPATSVVDQLLVQAVNLILSKLGHGILVEVRDGSICAKRSGQCRSYWSMTNTPTTNHPNQIDKQDYSVLYSVQQFVSELIEFVEHRRKESPQYSIWICLGELWPDGVSWNKKCVMVQITPVVMRLLHEISYSQGASSLTSSDMRLEISNSLTSTNDVLSLLKDIEEMMDWS